MSTSRRRALVPAISTIHFVQHVFRILPPMLPLLVVAFPYPLWQLGGLVSVYFAGSGLGQAPMGVLTDRYDRRFVIPPAVAMMGAGYLLFAAAPSIVPADVAWTVAGTTVAAQFLVVAAGSFVAGLGASAIHPAGYPLVTANVPDGRKGTAFGVWGGAAKLGDAAAPTAVAVLVIALRWNEVFLVFGVAGLAYAAALFALLSTDWVETRPAARRVAESADDATDSRDADDGIGERPDGESAAATDDESGGDASASRSGPDATPTDGPTDETVGAERDESRTERGSATGDRRRYAYPMTALVVFFVARAFSEKGLKAFLPLFLVGVYGYSFAFGGLELPPESFANIYFTAVFLVAVPLQLVTGRLADVYDHRTVLVAFMSVATVSLAVLAAASLSPVPLLVVLVVLGASNWGWTPARDALVSDVAPLSREGRTYGYLHTVSHLCSAVAPVAIGFVAGASGLRASFLLLVAVMVVAIVAIAALYSRRVYVPSDRTRPRPSSD